MAIETFGDLATNLGPWSTHNFQKQESKITGQALNELAPLMGIGEEIGELRAARSFDEFSDSLVDITVFAADFTWRLAEVWPAFNEEYNAERNADDTARWGYLLRNYSFSPYHYPDSTFGADKMVSVSDMELTSLKIGEMSQAYFDILAHLLKSHQGIRPDRIAAAPSVIADRLHQILISTYSIYSVSMYYNNAKPYRERINEVWDKVSKRDWTQQRNAAKESE